MKKTILYILLFTYLSMLLKPVLPLLTDCAAHIFWYSEHVATVHYENGKYHVHQEIKEAAKKNIPDQNQQDLKKEITTTEHFVPFNSWYFNKIFIPNLYPNFAFNICDQAVSGDFPPPRI